MHAAVLLQDGKIWLGGGCNEVKGLVAGQAPSCAVGNVLNTSVVYDPQGGSLMGPPLSQRRYGHQGFLRSDGKILVVGGMVVNSKNQLVPADQAELVEPEDPTSTSMPAGVAGSLGGMLPAGGLLWTSEVTVAGTTGGILLPGEASLPAPPVMQRSAAGLTVLPDGEALLSGGLDDMGNPLGTLELYQNGGFSELPAGAGDFAAYGHAAALLPDGTVLLAGGMLAGGEPTPLVSRYVHSLRLADATPPSWPTTGTAWLLPRRPDLFHFDGTTLSLGPATTGAGGRPLALALSAGVRWLAGELDVTVQLGAGAGAALIFGHLSDLDFYFVPLVPGQPVSVQQVKQGQVTPVAGCRGEAFPAPPAAGSSLAVQVSGGDLVLLVDGNQVLSCAVSSPRGAVGLGGLSGTARFQGFSLVRGT
jgi:hypothetical protein